MNKITLRKILWGFAGLLALAIAYTWAEVNLPCSYQPTYIYYYVKYDLAFLFCNMFHCSLLITIIYENIWHLFARWFVRGIVPAD